MVIFSVTNQLTGARVDVVKLDSETFEVELSDSDLHDYIGNRIFSTSSEAIWHAVEMS